MEKTATEYLRAMNPRNPRVITEERVEALRAALIAFGDLGGIVFNKRTNRLVGGHQRIKAFTADVDAKLLDVVPVEPPDAQGTVAHGWVEANGTRYSYREVLWDEMKETAAMLAANKFSGEWEWEGVSKLLQELNTGGVTDLRLTGFEPAELDTLLKAEWTVTAPAVAGAESKVDTIYLTDAARKALNGCKVLLAEADDAKTVERVGLAYLNMTRKP